MLPRILPHANKDTVYACLYTNTVTHTCQLWEGVRAANEVMALLWQRCAGVVCTLLLNKWIWNDLPRVSATWAQTHTHNTSFFPPSLFIQRHWQRETPTGGKKREKSGRAALSRPESHYLTNTKFTNVSFILQFRLLFCSLRLIHKHLFSDIMENMSALMLRIADSLTLASSATSTALSGEISTITR